jgi:hypothetical protein
MRIEEELRGALDVAAPPPVTRIEDVLARGRRKVALRRAGIAGSALAVVAVLTAGVLVWPSGSRGVLDPMNWARATQAPEVVADPPRNSRLCREQTIPSLVLSLGGEPLTETQMRDWSDLTQKALPDRQVASENIRRLANEGAHVFKVDIGGTDSLRFSHARFGDSPSAAADRALWATGACTPPRRWTNSGTVFQLYDATQTGQALYVFRADGRTLMVEQINIAGSLGMLPVKEADFVKLGAAVAEVL